MTDLEKAARQALEVMEENHHLIEEYKRPEYLAHYDRMISGVKKALEQQAVREFQTTEQPSPKWKGARFDSALHEQPVVQQEPEPPYEFERYVAGSLRAQGVRVERATTLADAMRIAAKICPPANPPSAPTVLVYTSPPASKPLTDEQMFEMVEIAWRHGWASCRDAEYVGEEAEDERWGMIGAEVVQDIAAHGIKENT